MSKATTHIAGHHLVVAGRARQRCAWCGEVLIDEEASSNPGYIIGAFVRLATTGAYVSDMAYGTTTGLPPGSCAQPVRMVKGRYDVE